MSFLAAFETMNSWSKSCVVISHSMIIICWVFGRKEQFISFTVISHHQNPYLINPWMSSQAAFYTISLWAQTSVVTKQSLLIIYWMTGRKEQCCSSRTISLHLKPILINPDMSTGATFETMHSCAPSSIVTSHSLLIISWLIGKK